MPTLHVNGIDIAYETSGDPHGVPMLLIMGLGMQLIAWPDALVDGLADQGYYVIRLDNRDSGLSTKFDAAGTPNIPLAFVKTLLRWPLKSPYLLDDMASDAVALLDALGVAKAHLVGVSMGGMIAQILAGRHPDRVLSLTSIMSSSGRRGLPGPKREAAAALMRRPRDPKNLDSIIANAANTFRIIGSPAYPTSEKQLRDRVGRAMRRNLCPGGIARQMVAVAASGERTGLLKTIQTRTLVIHGAADPLIPLACGKDTAALVPGARLEVIEGMGHDLPAQLIERLLALIDSHARGKMPAEPTARRYAQQ